MVLVFSQSSSVSATVMPVLYCSHMWLFTEVPEKAPALRVVQLEPHGSGWGWHGGDKATRWNSACPEVLWAWGPSWCHIPAGTADLTGGGGGGVQEGMRDSTVCCRSLLHPVVSSAAFGSPIAVPSNAAGDGEVTQPRVIKWCAWLSLSPFYSQ